MEEEEGTEGRQLSILVQNPLLFDHILECIISNMDLKSLPSCRLVNHQWEKFALPKLLEKIHNTIVVIPTIPRQENTSGNISKMERYLSYIAQKPGLIFSSFTLENVSFSGESGALLDKFKSTCAADVKDLKLTFNEYQTPKALVAMLGTFVNLKTLILDVDFICRFPSSLPTPVVHAKTLNLKRLSLNHNSVYADMVYIKFNAVLKSCESLEELFLGMPWPVIRHFYLPSLTRDYANTLVEISTGEINSEGLRHLMDLQDLKLRVLKCQRLVLCDEENRFSGFLEKYKNTLERVVVDEVHIGRQMGAKISEDYVIRFPDVMPKLRIFQMQLPAPFSHAFLGTGMIFFSPVNFPVQLPSLKKLILFDENTAKFHNFQSKNYDEWEYLSGFFEGSDPHLKVTHLCLPFASLKLRRAVGTVFPEIKSLKMETALDKTVHEIWKMWPQLKSLNLTLNGDRKKRRGKRVENFIAGTRTNESDADINSSLPSIANLKELKYFKLQTIGDCGGSLTDFSVSWAFCKLPCLEFILLSHHNISEEGTKELLEYNSLLKRVVCSDHPEVYKILREYLPNESILRDFFTASDSWCDCSFPK